jgi:hypothetical protein
LALSRVSSSKLLKNFMIAAIKSVCHAVMFLYRYVPEAGSLKIVLKRTYTGLSSSSAGSFGD